MGHLRTYVGAVSLAAAYVVLTSAGWTHGSSDQADARTAVAAVAPSDASMAARVHRAGDAPLTGPSDAPPESIVRDFLASHRLTISGGADAVLVLAASVRTPAGITHLRFTQRVGAVRVYRGDIKAAVDDRGKLLALNGELFHGPDAAPATLSMSAAVQRAAAGVGAPAPAVDERITSSPAGRGVVAFTGEGYMQRPTAELVLFPGSPARPAWLIVLPARPDAWYEVVVDAQDGALLTMSNLASAAAPEGQVFTGDPDDGPQVTVPFTGALPPPRDAWLSPPGTSTQGNNVIAGNGRDGSSVPIPANAVSGNFDFPFTNAYQTSGGTNPLADLNAGIANVFYWVDFLHDHYYELGFTEAAGNFQADNFGAGGAANDAVRALVQFDADSCFTQQCFNNAFFSSPPDGTPGILAVTLVAFPSRRVDGAFASDVIIHEYTHGLSSRLIDGLGGTQSRALAEGWSDWFAASITDDPVFGEYWTGTATGVRHYALDANPRTYGALCTIGAQGCEPHDDGEIWSATLWDLRAAFMAQDGAADGRARAEQVVVDGMMLTPATPTYLQARDAILQAALADDGEHCLLWDVFAARGLGVSATSPFGDAGFVVESFDLPAECGDDGCASAPVDDDLDGDGLDDDCDDDDDGDGLDDGDEGALGTDPRDTDSDDDGCADGPEVALGIGPTDPWDFFDVPVPALFASADPVGAAGDHVVTPGDAQAVLAYARVGAREGETLYEADRNQDGVKDGYAYDRSVASDASIGPPDGVVMAQDAQAAFAQSAANYDCT